MVDEQTPPSGATEDYEIAVATRADIPGILHLQEHNLPSQGGTLSVALSHTWFEAALADMPVIVARREGRVVGYAASAPFAAHAHFPIVQAQLRAYPCGDGAYEYGPICVAHSERGRGLAARLFATLQMQLPGREAVTFIRRDNTPSLHAHRRMGMQEVAEFTHGGVDYAVLTHKSTATASTAPPPPRPSASRDSRSGSRKYASSRICSKKR
jgi:L-amino acid N-acyltransferase YncA